MTGSKAIKERSMKQDDESTELMLMEEQSTQIIEQSITPMQMLQIAVQKGTDLAQMEKLMELDREWKKDRAREAYYEAISEFKKVAVNVTKDKVNKQYESRYTSIGNFVNTVNSAMAPFGLNARWSLDQEDKITVTCILSHKQGHSESVSMSGPPDSSGSKNPLQQIKSTITYLEISTYQAVTGVVSQDANLDDDGNAAVEAINEEQLANIEALITEVDADRDAFIRYLNVEQLNQLPVDKYKTAVKALERKRNQ